MELHQRGNSNYVNQQHMSLNIRKIILKCTLIKNHFHCVCHIQIRQAVNIIKISGTILQIVYIYMTTTDLITPTFFAYFLRFWAPKYALRIPITELRTREIPIF